MTKPFNLLDTSSTDERQGSSWDDGTTLWKTEQMFESLIGGGRKFTFYKSILRLSTTKAISSCSNSLVLETKVVTKIIKSANYSFLDCFASILLFFL